MARTSGTSHDPNNPSTSVDYAAWEAQGHTAGPFGNDPAVEARGDFGKPVRDLRPT